MDGGEFVTVEAFNALVADVTELKKVNKETTTKCDLLFTKYKELVKSTIVNFNNYLERITIIEKAVKAVHGSVTDLEVRFNAQLIVDSKANGDARVENMARDLAVAMKALKASDERMHEAMMETKDEIKRELTVQFVGEIEKFRQHQSYASKELAQLKIQFETVMLDNQREAMVGTPSGSMKRQIDGLKKRITDLEAINPNKVEYSEEVKHHLEQTTDEINLRFNSLQNDLFAQQINVQRHVIESFRRMICVDRSLYADIKNQTPPNERVITLTEGNDIGLLIKESFMESNSCRVHIPGDVRVKWKTPVHLRPGLALYIEGESLTTSVISIRTHDSMIAQVGGFSSLALSNVRVEVKKSKKKRATTSDADGLFVIQRSEDEAPGMIILSSCDVDSDRNLVFVSSGAFGWVGLSSLSLTNSNWSIGKIVHPVEISSRIGSPPGFALVSQKNMSLCGEGVEWNEKMKDSQRV